MLCVKRLLNCYSLQGTNPYWMLLMSLVRLDERQQYSELQPSRSRGQQGETHTHLFKVVWNRDGAAIVTVDGGQGLRKWILDLGSVISGWWPGSRGQDMPQGREKRTSWEVWKYTKFRKLVTGFSLWLQREQECLAGNGCEGLCTDRVICHKWKATGKCWRNKRKTAKGFFSSLSLSFLLLCPD